ncbi:MAG: methyltransferase [Thermoleophilales bacterium]|nr:methyltransferase [Thermoleophilales bacterium]
MTATEPGSFRDRDSRVVLSGDAIYRALSPEGAEDWDALSGSPLLGQLTAAGKVIGTREVDPSILSESRGLLPTGVARVLEHDRVPFVSYPYEWTFSMLQDAAKLQLELGASALDFGLDLKDATPYNVQFLGSRPTFIDIGSFEKITAGEPWIAYRQFCMLYLYPLLFQAHKDIPFQPWMRGSIDGIQPIDAVKVFSLRDRLRSGVFLHTSLHARLDRRAKRSGPGSAEENRNKRQVKPGQIKAQLESMNRLVSKLKWKAGETSWSGYRQSNTYSDEDDRRKQAFVAEVAAEEEPGLTWDMGCNDGAYSRIAAGSSKLVVAFDFDHATVEALYRSLREEGNTKILPLVSNLADPSPALGWRGLERKTLVDRGAPDLMLALALIHHVSISANIPIADFLQWARDLGTTLLIEFPKRTDPMVRALLANKHAGANPDYEEDNFERELKKRFTVDRREELPSGDRILYLAHPRR